MWTKHESSEGDFYTNAEGVNIQAYGNDERYPEFKAKLDSGEIVPVKFEDTDEEIARKAEFDSKEWERNRVKAYAALGNQFEVLYDKGMVGWKADIKAIKDLYPKP